MALYRTEGPFLHNISVFTSPARLEAGKTFVIEVKGNLAGRSNQPPGQLLQCFITMKFFEMQLFTPRALIKLFPDLKRFASMNALIISLHWQVLFAYLYLKLF